MSVAPADTLATVPAVRRRLDAARPYVGILGVLIGSLLATLGNRVTTFGLADLRGALHGHVAGWSPGTGSVFSLLPPDNATGNFTKVVQRVPVKIVLDADPTLGTLVRPGMSVVAVVDASAGAKP